MQDRCDSRSENCIVCKSRLTGLLFFTIYAHTAFIIFPSSGPGWKLSSEWGTKRHTLSKMLNPSILQKLWIRYAGSPYNKGSGDLGSISASQTYYNYHTTCVLETFGSNGSERDHFFKHPM